MKQHGKMIVRDLTDQKTHNVQHLLGVETDHSELKNPNFLSRIYNWAHRRTETKRPTLNIALVFSHLDNYCETTAARKMVDSLERTYGETYSFEFSVMTANNSLTKLDTIVEEEFLRGKSNRYDACIGFAPWIVAQMRDLLLPEGMSMPLLFNGIASPEKLGLVGTKGDRRLGLTGVISKVPSHDTAVKTIRQLNPKLETLLIPYDSDLTHAGWPERCYGASGSFSASWKAAGGRTQPIDVTGCTDIAAKLMTCANTSTLINLSMHSSVIVQTQAIIQACNKRGIPVYAHNRQAIRQGAVMGSGGNTDEYGAWLALLIGEICIEKRPLDEIPLPIVTEQPEVCYFEESLAKQGFGHLDETTLRAMRMLPIHKVV